MSQKGFQCILPDIVIHDCHYGFPVRIVLFIIFMAQRGLVYCHFKEIFKQKTNWDLSFSRSFTFILY